MEYFATIMIILSVVVLVVIFGKRDTPVIKTNIENFKIDPEIEELTKKTSIENRDTNVTPKFSNRHISDLKAKQPNSIHEHTDEMKLNSPQGDHHNKHHNNKFDQTFSNTIKYDNKEGVWLSGWRKCIEECSGDCVEYGYTNNGVCFPPLGSKDNIQNIDK